MKQEPHNVVQRSRLRRRAVRVVGNLLILIGAVVLGSSIVAASRSPDNAPAEVPTSAVTAVAQLRSSPTATRTPSATAVPSVPATTPTTARGRVEPRESTPEQEPEVRSPRLPRPGEGLLEPVESQTASSSPYAQNLPGERAVHISIPTVGIDTEIKEVSPVAVQIDNQTVFEWPVVDWAAGHHSTSANPGEGGNIVIAGHDDVRGEVFRGLHDIEIGDEVIVSTDSTSYTYVVQEIHMRLYTTASLDEQLTVGAFIGPMPEERLTLVTCWPYQIDTHRMIVVAKPV